MGRWGWAGPAGLYVVVVALLTVAGRRSPCLADAAAVLALALTMPAGLLHPLLALLPHHLGWYALPALALLNVVVLRAARRFLPRDRVGREVESRLDGAVVATGLAVTPMRRPAGRRRRSLLLRDVPIEFPRLVGVYRELWREGGLRVQQQQEPLALRAYDDQGYEYALEAGPGVFGDAVLRVTAPPAGHRGFAAGLAVAGVPGLVAALTTTGPALLLTGAVALVGGLSCLVAPHTRGFGRGLLCAGVPALVVLVLFTAG